MSSELNSILKECDWATVTVHTGNTVNVLTRHVNLQNVYEVGLQNILINCIAVTYALDVVNKTNVQDINCLPASSQDLRKCVPMVPQKCNKGEVTREL